MKLCINCVLPETFPGISFNEQGVCHLCQAYKGHQHLQREKEKYRQKFEDLVRARRIPGGYEVLMAYSGGKDSTFTLHLLKQEYGLNILALTFDNGFISPLALENIRRVVEHLGIDHILMKPRFDWLRQIFMAGSRTEIYSAKTLERASTICTSCMGLVKFISLKMALEKAIPFIAYGWSPGQAPLTAAIFKNNPSMIREMQRSIQEPLTKIVGHEIQRYFLTENDFERTDHFPYNVSPLAFLDYNEKVIYETIKSLGWSPPTDTDANSSNCLLNSYANIIHRQRYQFHPYAFEMAKLVREGYLDRAEALAKLETPEAPQTVQLVEQRLRFAEP